MGNSESSLPQCRASDTINVLKEGFMEKRIEPNQYQRRYVVLFEDETLVCAQKQNDLRHRERFNLPPNYQIEGTSSTSFEMTASGLVLGFRCKNEGDCTEWINAFHSLQSMNDQESGKGNKSLVAIQDKIHFEISSETERIANINNIDLKLFKRPNTGCLRHVSFVRSPAKIPVTDKCAHIRRLCEGAKYFEALKNAKLDDETKHTLFVEFNEVVYDSVLEDTIHFVTVHSDEIQKIHSEWTEQYGVPKCSISECTKTQRHYGRRRRDRKRNQQDAVYSFNEALYDRLHHFIFHLYDIGLRVQTPSVSPNHSMDDKKEVDSGIVSVNNVFAAERDMIQSQREKSKVDLDRFAEKGYKFTINSASATKEAVTLLDALFQKMMKNEEVQRRALWRLRCFVEDQSFDSESIAMDVDDLEESNIYTQIQSEVAVELMSKFIRTIKLRRRAFSTGFVFNYWNENDKMFVKPIHKNLKDEILESGHLSAEQWQQFVEFKAKKYIYSNKCKKLRNCRAKWGTTTGKAKRDTHITLEHLFAIILYCDFGLLCTEFSGTFRLSDTFEELSSTMQRHSHFAIFARFLVEAVVNYGINGFTSIFDTDYQKGPFFCGINCVLNIGSFAIKLMGPCSTTTVREVAVNFAKANGVILKLDNDAYEFRAQTFFDCSWISNYHEEAEKLWIAGEQCLRIVSIVLVRSAKDYWKAMNALYLFDAMISGINLHGSKIKETSAGRKLISKLIDLELSGGLDGCTEFDIYLKNEWQLFIQRKTEIYLRLPELHQNFKLLSRLVMFNVDMNDEEKKGVFENVMYKHLERELQDEATQVRGDDKTNILRPKWLSIFPALKTVRINTGTSFSFQMIELLKVLDSVTFPHSLTLIVESGKRWFESALTEGLRAEFDAKGWEIKNIADEYL